MSGPAPSLAQQAAGRELAALIDGPWRLRWYWRDQLEAMQTATRVMGHADHEPAAQLRHYRPTERWVTHPHEDDVPGRAWTYQPDTDGED